jgi:hypothetical protein
VLAHCVQHLGTILIEGLLTSQSPPAGAVRG